MFPKLSDAKASGGIFVGPQIKVMSLACEELVKNISAIEKPAWIAFINIVHGSSKSVTIRKQWRTSSKSMWS